MSHKLWPLKFESEITYLKGKDIREYDMRSGGYSITLSENLIEDESFMEELIMSTKHERHVMLGNYAKKDKEFVKELNDGFRKYVSAFIRKNNIGETNVLSIKKDSVTFFNSTINRTKFKEVVFTERCRFTSMLKIGKLEFYYNIHTGKTLVKGLNLMDYTGTLVEEIFKLMKLAEFSPKKLVEFRLAEIRQAYVNRELEDSYYKELSPTGGFLVNTMLTGNIVHSNSPLASGDEFFDDIDISYNYMNILMPLFRAML